MKSTTNFEASGSTELIRSRHNVRDQWHLKQGTNKDASRCTRSVASEPKSRTSVQEGRFRKIGSTRISRNQRETLRISRNVVCRGLKLGIVYQFPAKTTTNKQFPRCTCCISVFCHNITQLCRRTTPPYCCSTLNETLFERKCLQARFLVFQAKTRGRRASQGVVDTTTVHHQSSRNLSRFFANPAVRISSTKRMQTASSSPSAAASVSAADEDLATRLNRLECQGIRDMFDSLPCSNSEFAMKTKCPPCEVPSGRVVHPLCA